jgi:hypothetical protein
VGPRDGLNAVAREKLMPLVEIEPWTTSPSINHYNILLSEVFILNIFIWQILTGQREMEFLIIFSAAFAVGLALLQQTCVQFSVDEVGRQTKLQTTDFDECEHLFTVIT